MTTKSNLHSPNSSTRTSNSLILALKRDTFKCRFHTEIAALRDCVEHNGLVDLAIKSIENELPIAQFIVDKYMECAFLFNWTVNEFMNKSKFLSSLNRNSTEYNLIRTHLAQYLKHCFLPIPHKDFNQNNDNNRARQKPKMSRILYRLSTIHKSIHRLSKVRQTDIYFNQYLDGINESYFAKQGIKFEKLNPKGTINQMLRRFNNKLGNTKNKRCCILVTEEMYIFEPLENNSVPPEICRYTELPFICNSKSNPLPDVNLSRVDTLCLSLHRHCDRDDCVNINTERLYVFCGKYGSRAFKYNLPQILAPFCNSRSTIPPNGWIKESKTREFKDCEYTLFGYKYFADLNFKNISLKNVIKLQETVGEYRRNARGTILESLSLKTNEEYSYRPTAMDYYRYMNDELGNYYKSSGIKGYNDRFIKYIIDNGLDQEPLEDNLRSIDDCVLMSFDDDFPTMNGGIISQREEFIFSFLRKPNKIKR